MKRALLPFMLLVFFVAFLSADGELVSASVDSLLAKTGRTSKAYPEGKADFALMPNSLISTEIRANLQSVKPNLLIEELFYLDAQSLPGQGLSLEERNKRMYNVLRSISTLKGITYFSVSQNGTKTLFTESTVVTSDSAKKPIPDPLVESPPKDSTVAVFQNDTTFGGNYYTYRYRFEGEEMGFIMRNTSPMRYVIDVVGAGSMCTGLCVQPYKKGYLVYIASGANALALFGMQARLETSFSNRAIAIFDWFSARLATEFAK